MARSKIPSNAVAKGGSLGTSVGAALDVVAAILGHPLPPGGGAILGGTLASLFAFFARGGRKGEPD